MLGVGLPLLLGYSFRRQAQLDDALATARRALVVHQAREERRQMARDVHDVVAHGLAAMVVQITSARHVLSRDPAEADRALADAEAVGRSSLRELRSVVVLLREEEPDATRGAPAASGLRALVDGARAAACDSTRHCLPTRMSTTLPRASSCTGWCRRPSPTR